MTVLWLAVCFLLNIEIGYASSALNSVCSCFDPALCRPIKGKSSKWEVVAFSMGSPTSGYQQFDWNKITTLVLAGANIGNNVTNDIVCLAHKNKVKVQVLVHFSTEQVINSTFRQIFINETIQTVQKYHLDGVNMDFEGLVTPNGPAFNALTVLMQNLRATLKNVNQLYGLSMDYVFCAFCSTPRTYDIRKIMNYIDYFVLMDYDMQGTITYQSSAQNLCWKIYNSPLPAVIRGMKSFLQANISASQLVLAFPWYGNYYKCKVLDKTTNRCYVDCVTKVRRTISYGGVMTLLRSGPYQRIWNPLVSMPVFNFNRTDGVYQMNYDDPISLGMKYNVSVSYNLRGVGMWNADFLDYSMNTNATKDRIAMWNAIPRPN